MTDGCRSVRDGIFLYTLSLFCSAVVSLRVGSSLSPIGIWGQRHLRYIKQNHKVLYLNLLTSGKLNGYLADLDKQADEMFSLLVKQMSESEGVTEQLKADNQMEWVDQMNNIRGRATEMVNTDLIYG